MANELEMKPWGLRFVDPGDETDFRMWRIQQALPLMRLAGAVSLPVWLVFPALTLRFLEFDRTSLWLNYGLSVPLLILGVLGSYVDSLQRWSMHASALILGVAGCVLCLWIAPATFESLGFAVAGTVLFGMFAPFMRMPLAFAMLALLPFEVPVAYMVVDAGLNGILGPGEAYGLVAMIVAGAFVVVVMSIVNDRSHRYEFINVQAIERQQLAIRRYLPGSVAEQILGGKESAIAEPQRRRITILFCDIVGFTDIADRVEPEVMTDVLNAYMSAMAETIEAHGGTLNEFAGDGLMALFGAPEAMPPEDQARSAVAAAQAMQAKMPELNAAWRKQGLGTELKVRIGINTGMASVGSYGSEGRVTYTAIGLQTNIAARIESAAEPGQTLLSDATFQLISGTVSCEPRGEIEVKGVHFPVRVYVPGGAN